MDYGPVVAYGMDVQEADVDSDSQQKNCYCHCPWPATRVYFQYCAQLSLLPRQIYGCLFVTSLRLLVGLPTGWQEQFFEIVIMSARYTSIASSTRFCSNKRAPNAWRQGCIIPHGSSYGRASSISTAVRKWANAFAKFPCLYSISPCNISALVASISAAILLCKRLLPISLCSNATRNNFSSSIASSTRPKTKPQPWRKARLRMCTAWHFDPLESAGLIFHPIAGMQSLGLCLPLRIEKG